MEKKMLIINDSIREYQLLKKFTSHQGIQLTRCHSFPDCQPQAIQPDPDFTITDQSILCFTAGRFMEKLKKKKPELTTSGDIGPVVKQQLHDGYVTENNVGGT